MQKPLFPLGQVVMTPGAIEAMQASKIYHSHLLIPHATGDYVGMCPEDIDANHDAIREGGRVFSAYTVRGRKFWVITEADRSATTILLPSEY